MAEGGGLLNQNEGFFALHDYSINMHKRRMNTARNRVRISGEGRSQSVAKTHCRAVLVLQTVAQKPLEKPPGINPSLSEIKTPVMSRSEGAGPFTNSTPNT